MSEHRYMINKGVNHSLVFKGLKGQYIWHAGGGMFAVLLLYAALYVAGVNHLICLGISICAGLALLAWIYHLSNTYGEHGLTKAIARRKLPAVIKSRSRKVFMSARSLRPKP
jgi:hypothetical protein